MKLLGKVGICSLFLFGAAFLAAGIAVAAGCDKEKIESITFCPALIGFAGVVLSVGIAGFVNLFITMHHWTESSGKDTE